MGIQTDPLTEFYYSVEDKEHLFKFWCVWFNDDDSLCSVAENAAGKVYDQSNNYIIADWPLTFTIYNRDKKKLGVFVVEIGGWNPEFTGIPKS